MVVAPYRHIGVRIKFVILAYFLVFIFLDCTENIIRLKHFEDLLSFMYQFVLPRDLFQTSKMYKVLSKCGFDKIMCNSFTSWEVK